MNDVLEMTTKEIFETMEYGPALESRQFADEWLDKHDRQFDLFIDGKWQPAKKGGHFECNSPSTKEVLAKAAEASKEDVDAAVDAAKKALPGWAALGGHGRARYLYALARQVQKHSRLFAVLESLDNGKPVRESRDMDVPAVARHLYHHAGWAQLMESEMTDHQEVGVVGAIIPCNFPLMILVRKIAPALAMGNTVVVKPAKLTSLSALFLAEICEAIDLPPGVLNVTTGSGCVVGKAIVEHPAINLITFSGSTTVGKGIRRVTAGTGKTLALQLGGKSPIIVFEDADIDSAVEGIVDGIWFNQGQISSAGSRLLAQESIYAKLIAKLKAKMDKLRVGNPLDNTVDLGAIVDDVHLKTMTDYVEIAKKQGADVYQPSLELPKEGFYFPPTLCTNVSPASTIVQEETFGPVIVSMSFRTPNEAVALANDTVYGLAASVWTENINLALDMAPKIKAGTVWINCHNVFDAAAGFGGFRDSGIGREGGFEGLWDFVKPKWELASGEMSSSPKSTVTVAGNDGDAENESASKLPTVDRTTKMFIGGKQSRPAGGYSIKVFDHDGLLIGDVGIGNRKDIRNAVEAAHADKKWASMTGHQRAQVIYYIAENLSARAEEFAKRIVNMTGVDYQNACEEVDLSIERLYLYASYADKYDGRVHHTISRYVTLAMPEPVGVVGISCPEYPPLLGFISTVIPALAMGNRVVVVPSEKHPLSATDFYQVLETSDLPSGAINIVTGDQKELLEVLAKHDGIQGIWHFGAKNLSQLIEAEAANNMKRTWLSYGKRRDWYDKGQAHGTEFLHNATEIKNIWMPYGE